MSFGLKDGSWVLGGWREELSGLQQGGDFCSRSNRRPGEGAKLQRGQGQVRLGQAEVAAVRGRLTDGHRQGDAGVEFKMGPVSCPGLLHSSLYCRKRGAFEVCSHSSNEGASRRWEF